MDNTMIASDATSSQEEFAAWIGLDWADQKHQIALYDVASSKVELHTLKSSPEGMQEWLASLRTRYGGAKVALVLEQSRGSVLYALIGYDFVVLYPVNPQALSNYRKVFYPSGAKSDPVDAMLMLDMVRKSPEHFHVWKADDDVTRSLKLLVEDRRKLVNQLTRLTNQLTSRLKTYFPQALDLAGELDTRQACDFLKRWPTLEDLQSARPATLRKFYESHGRPRKDTLEQRLQQITKAVPLTKDRAAVLSGSLMVQALIAQIRPLVIVIEDFDDHIKQLFQKHPDHLVFESFPGAGEVLAPRLQAAFGADRERIQSAAEMQTLSGVAPVTEQSGKKEYVHWRRGCPKFLRQTFQEFAAQSILRSDWARAYYDQLRNKGKSHNQALRALAYKWIRIMFHCWKTHTPYDEQIYLIALAKRGSGLYAPAIGVGQMRRLKKLKPAA